MGIQGLLPLLKSIMVPIHIKDLEGCSVAVDTYSWLHKGALSCSKDLCIGQPTTKYPFFYITFVSFTLYAMYPDGYVCIIFQSKVFCVGIRLLLGTGIMGLAYLVIAD